MIEVLLFFLISWLCFFGTFALRVLNKQENNKVINTFIKDWESEPKPVKVNPDIKPSYVTKIHQAD